MTTRNKLYLLCASAVLAACFCADTARADETFDYYKAQAQAGEASAMQTLAVLYAEGNGTKPDCKKAMKWFKKVLRQPIEEERALAKYNIAVMYASGKCAEKDEAKALKWYKKSVKDGSEYSARSASAAGDIYAARGNDKTAFEWYLRAALAGDPWGAYRAGTAYLDGMGTPKDEEKGLSWLYAASLRESAPAQYTLGLILQDKSGAENCREAARWYGLAAKQGYPKAVEALKTLSCSIR